MRECRICIKYLCVCVFFFCIELTKQLHCDAYGLKGKFAGCNQLVKRIYLCVCMYICNCTCYLKCKCICIHFYALNKLWQHEKAIKIYLIVERKKFFFKFLEIVL